MSQPIWKLLWATDCQALYTDETGVYDPELAVADDCGDSWQVYRVPLEGLKMHHAGDRWRVLDDCYGPDCRCPIGQYRPWYWKHLPSVARSVGCTTLALVRDLISGDPSRLARAYDAIAGYHGWINFDEYPDTWNEHEIAAWPDRGPATGDDESAGDL